MTSTDTFSRTGALDVNDERARRAVKVFRGMQPTLSAYARALTKNSTVRVELATETNGSTNGKKIFFRPPIALGDLATHRRELCDKRDENLQQRCEACRVREDVLVVIYHEIAHICYNTFMPVTDADRVDLMRRAIDEVGGKYADELMIRYNTAPSYIRESYMAMAGLISEFLPLIVNSLEDSRVNAHMFESRKGTRVMFHAQAWDIFNNGVQQSGSGSRLLWSEYPVNMQMIIGLFCKVSGYDYSNWFHAKVVADLDDPLLDILVAEATVAETPSVIYNLSFKVLAQLRNLGYCKSEKDPIEEEAEDEQGEPSGESKDEPKSAEEASEAGTEPDGMGDSTGDPEASSEASDTAGGGKVAPRESESSDANEPQDAPEDEGEPESGAPDADADGKDSGKKDASGSGEEDVSDTGDSDGGDELDSDEPGNTSEDGPGSGTPDSERKSDAESDDGPADVEGDSQPEGSESDSGTGAGSRDPADNTGADNSENGSVDDQPADDSDGTGDRGGSPVGNGDLGDEGSDSDTGDQAPAEAGSSSGEESDVNPGGDGNSSESSNLDVEETETPEGVIDTLPDEGEGGISVTENPEFDEGVQFGTADDIAPEVMRWLGHPEDGPLSPRERLEKTDQDAALDKAVIQGAYFETPSVAIYGVREHFYDKDHPGLDERLGTAWKPKSRRVGAATGVSGEFDPSESVLGPALLRMRVAFADNKRGRDLNNLKSGKVNPRVLGKRAFIGDERLFKSRVIPGKKDYFVLIGMDVSYSTVGVNIALEKRAVMAQANLLQRMGIKFAIYAHSADYHSPSGRGGLDIDIYEIKSPDEIWNENTKVRLREIGPDSANLDGHAVERFRKICDRQSETDKIIMYYSDGKMPAENHDEELDILQREIRICKQKRYTLMGVGIRTDSPSRHGLDTVQVDSDADIVRVIRHLEKRLLAV